MTPDATINVSVSSHYKEADYASEITSQGILGERVEIMEEGELFSKIRQEDGYTSWISSDQVWRGNVPAGAARIVRSHFIRIHKEPDASSEAIREAVIGCSLQVLDDKDDWYRIVLPDGQQGWANSSGFGTFAKADAANVVDLAAEFLGYQYIWGGRTPKGFDCSGLVQTVYGLLGITLPRDSWQQQQQNQLSDDFRDAQPGDLLFFGKTPERVTHVAISVGPLRFIHASGWVRYNSFNNSDNDFSPEHIDRFISLNRYL